VAKTSPAIASAAVTAPASAGATQGLGLALVEGLAARMSGDDVVYLTGRDPARIAEAAAGISSGRAEVRSELLDVTDTAGVNSVASVLSDRHGGLDIVFSNAYRRTQPSDASADVVADYVETNNFGTTRVLRAFGPLLRDRGRMIVVASTMGTLHYLAPVLHGRFDRLESLDDADAVVRRWRDAVLDGSALAEAWPAFINIPSKVGQVAAVRAIANMRRDHDERRGILIAAVCPGMVNTAASRAWFDMSSAQTPAEAAGPLIDLVLDPEPDPAFYGELIRFGRRLPWSGEKPATGPRGRVT
jgi:NAD(P)-dependent dehydrogenase (short-subunit alcohol dehydrogenase family)